MQPSDPPLQQYLDVFRRQISLVILMPVLTIAVAYSLLEVRAPVYRAATTLVVGYSSGGPRPPSLGTTSITRTMTSLLEGDLVARDVIRRLRLNTTPRRFEKDLKVEVLPDTAVLNVTYDSTDPKLALAVVTEMSRIFQRRIGEALGVRSGGGGAPPGGSFELIVRQFDPPHVESEPVSRSRASTLVLAGIAGIVLGLMLAVARDSLDFRIRGGKDAEEWFGAPVVGALPKARRLPVRSGRPDPQAQSLELLLARLQFSEAGIAGPTILVTSSRANEGKSSVTASLGAALSRADRRIICVEADLRRPSLHRYLGVPADRPGLVDVLERGLALDEALVPVDSRAIAAATRSSGNGSGPASERADPQLFILPAGTTPARLGRIFTAEAVADLVAQLHGRADYVIFDSPPLIVADSFALARQCDTILVVARRGRTTKEQAESARATLEGLGVRNVSIVLTNAPAVETYA